MMLISILIGFAILCLLVLIGLMLYLLLVFLPRIRRTVDSIRQTVDGELKSLLEQIKGEVPKIGQTLQTIDQNVSAISAQVREMNEREIKPIAQNVRQMTEQVSGSVSKIVEFSKETIEKAELYRDRLFKSVEEIISLWKALKAGGTVIAKGISKYRRKGKEEVSDYG